MEHARAAWLTEAAAPPSTGPGICCASYWSRDRGRRYRLVPAARLPRKRLTVERLSRRERARAPAYDVRDVFRPAHTG